MSELTANDFDNDFNLTKNDSKKRSIILFYSPQCGHCTRFKPTYLEFMDEVNNGKYGQDVSAYIINTAEQRDLMKKMFTNMDQREYLVEGVPMVVSYFNKVYYSTYGPGQTENDKKRYRTKEDLVEYLEGVGTAPITYTEK